MASLPDECFSDILTFLDIQSLYKCLFVSRKYCKFSIPIIWRHPFDSFESNHKISLVNTLLTCLNEDEISSLIPCIIDIEHQSPLFEYGKFIRKFNHHIFGKIIEVWLEYSSDEFDVNDCRAQKLVNTVYQMILRQGSNIQEIDLIISQDNIHIDLPRFSVFTTYKPGITNLRTLHINFDSTGSDSTMRYHNTIEFLSMVPKFCSIIVNCYTLILESTSEFIEPFLNIIKSQPLEVMLMRRKVDKDLLHTLKCRAETLKKLSFEYIDFQDVDLSFISTLSYLELLEFNHCYGFIPKNFENLPKKKLRLDKLNLWYNDGVESNINIAKSMIDVFCGKELFKLSLNIIAPETIIAVKDACPNIGFLHIKIVSEKFLNSTIPLICELSSLKTLNIQTGLHETDLLVRILCNYLTSVEYLTLDFYVDLTSFEYFTDNCNANLKRWNLE